MNKQTSIQNTKGRPSNSATAVIKKRINSVFQESQLILIWATFKPIKKKLAFQLEKKTFLGQKSCGAANAANAIKAYKNEKIEQNQNLLTFIFEEGDLKITKISKISLPKNALQTFCFNFNLTIVGSGLDLLIVTKTDLPFASLAFPARAKVATPTLAEKPDSSSTTLSALNEPIVGLNRLIKTHQAALFLNLALEEACKLEEKWDSNQLLGAFIKNPQSATFITNAELKQTVLLHKCLKLTPEQVIKQPFIELLVKMKAAYLGQSKWLNPLKNFLFIINYSKLKLLLNLSLASAKKKS